MSPRILSSGKENAMLEVRMERVSQSINEKKVLNPTMKMMEFALSNAGFGDGLWTMRAPHRTRKRGAERFRAMRLDGSGIRVRCKPAGNDTCYEWTLLPPQELDQDAVFSDLCSLHPSSMKSTKSSSVRREEAAVLAGLFNRVVESKPGLLDDSLRKPPVILQPKTEQQEKVTPRAMAAFVAPAVKEDALRLKAEEPQQKAAPREKTRIESLDVSEVEDSLSSDFVMDRALVAFNIASSGSEFVRRPILSESLIRLLNIGDLTKKSDVYGSVKGAMRALMMALCSKGYIERVMYGQKSTNGYRITGDGKRRLEFLHGIVDASLQPKAGEVSTSDKPKAQASFDEKTISLIKGLIGEHEDIKRQIGEFEELIKELGNELENDNLIVSGLGKVLSEKTAERESLEKEIARLESKIGLLRVGREKKATDMGELRSEMAKLQAKKSEIESRLSDRV